MAIQYPNPKEEETEGKSVTTGIEEPDTEAHQIEVNMVKQESPKSNFIIGYGPFQCKENTTPISSRIKTLNIVFIFSFCKMPAQTSSS